MAESVLLAGTRKGLFIGRSDGTRESWTWDPPAFPMEEVYSVAVGAEPQAVLVGSSHPAFGPAVYLSIDGGRTFDRESPAQVRFPDDLGDSVERIWQLVASPSDPGVVGRHAALSALSIQ